MKLAVSFMKCTLSLSLATVCNEFFIFFHVYIESFNTRIRSSLHIGYTIRLMGRVRTAAGGEEQLLHLLMFGRVSNGEQEAAAVTYMAPCVCQCHGSLQSLQELPEEVVGRLDTSSQMQT